jgi:predicted component of type VI protein secretion system
MKAELVPENGDPPIPITKDLTVVGRRGDLCDIAIDDPSLSKRHCVLVKTDGLLVIRDLNTTNGTKVKGQKIRWAALLPGDRITMGAYRMKVYLGPDDTPGPSERYLKKLGGGASSRPGAGGPTSAVPGSAVYAEHLGATSSPVVGFAEPSPLEVIPPGLLGDDRSNGGGSRTESPLELEIELDEDDEIIEIE